MFYISYTDYTAEEKKRSDIDNALKILGGGDNWRESDYVQSLNKKYGYSFKKMAYGGYELVCEEGKGSMQYYVEMFEDLKALLWKIGETVKVQWLVYPNGYQFEFYAYETNVQCFHCEGSKRPPSELLNAIYN